MFYSNSFVYYDLHPVIIFLGKIVVVMFDIFNRVNISELLGELYLKIHTAKLIEPTLYYLQYFPQHAAKKEKMRVNNLRTAFGMLKMTFARVRN